MALPASSASTADRYISLILNQSESLGVLHQEQIRRNQERLQEFIAEFERLRTAETKRLEETVQALDQKFKKMLTKLQEDFVILAHEASEQFKTDVRNSKRQYEKKLENRARELALELQSASFNSDILRQARDNVSNVAGIQPAQFPAHSAALNPDHNRDERNELQSSMPTMPQVLGFNNDSRTESHPKTKSFDDKDNMFSSRRSKLPTSVLTKEDGDHNDENVRNQITKITCRSADAKMKLSNTERHTLTARLQLPEFKSKEIAFVKGRLRVLLQSMEKLDHDNSC